ncbi:MAG: homoserine kinase [Sulfuriferula sp.]
MSVFTTVTPDEASHWLGQYAIGTLVELNGISSGIENTNYFLTTTHGRYVLTLFEKLTHDELPYFLNLMDHLARHGVPCPQPVATIADSLLTSLNGKPASIVSCLSGRSLEIAGMGHCAQVGETLADIHLAGKTFSAQRINPRGAAWWKVTAQQVAPFLDAEAAQLLNDEVRFQTLHRLQDLPRGVVHADLFRDNVLFDGERLGGVIDFYFACHDVWLYDIAIAVNDWCVSEEGGLDEERMLALLSAYHAVRPFMSIERGAWPVMLRAAALRFWVSRMYDLYFPRAGELTHAKDPLHFERILRQRVAAQSQLQRIWV